jgi:hypothetical protein
LQRHRLLARGNRLGPVARAILGQRERVQIEIVRREFGCPAGMPERLIVFGLRTLGVKDERPGQIVQGFGIVGLQADRLLVLDDGLCEPTLDL